MTDLALILAQAQAALAVGLVVFLRVGGAMAVLPAFGEQAVPERLRLMLAVAFTAGRGAGGGAAGGGGARRARRPGCFA